MDTRINARLDEEAARQVEYLTIATGQSVSDVVREAISVYHAQVRQRRKGGGSKFLAMAGTGDSGLTDLSTNYKRYLTESLEQKYGLSPVGKTKKK